MWVSDRERTWVAKGGFPKWERTQVNPKFRSKVGFDKLGSIRGEMTLLHCFPARLNAGRSRTQLFIQDHQWFWSRNDNELTIISFFVLNNEMIFWKKSKCIEIMTIIIKPKQKNDNNNSTRQKDNNNTNNKTTKFILLECWINKCCNN